MKYSEKIQKVLQQITQDAENFKKKGDELVEEFKKSKDSLSLIEDFLYKVGSLTTNSFEKGLEEIKEVVEKIGEDYIVLEEDYSTLEKGESMLSLRLEISSTLEDLVKYIPDVLLRENLEILARILRDKKLIKADSIFLLFKKSV